MRQHFLDRLDPPEASPGSVTAHRLQFAPLRSAPHRFALLRSTPFYSALLRSALLRSAQLCSQPLGKPSTLGDEDRSIRDVRQSLRWPLESFLFLSQFHSVPTRRLIRRKWRTLCIIPESWRFQRGQSAAIIVQPISSQSIPPTFRSSPPLVTGSTSDQSARRLLRLVQDLRKEYKSDRQKTCREELT